MAPWHASRRHCGAGQNGEASQNPWRAIAVGIGFEAIHKYSVVGGIFVTVKSDL